jgi:hypothetical protein
MVAFRRRREDGVKIFYTEWPLANFACLLSIQAELRTVEQITPTLLPVSPKG